MIERWDPEGVERNVREAATIDLLDRVTAYREGMEPEAIPIIEAELARRGVDRAAIARHEAEECSDILRRPEGFAYRCSCCDRPAVVRVWGWHRLWDRITVPFPRLFNYCREHAPEPAAEATSEEA